jgi:hypothetical protein
MVMKFFSPGLKRLSMYLNDHLYIVLPRIFRANLHFAIRLHGVDLKGKTSTFVSFAEYQRTG